MLFNTMILNNKKHLEQLTSASSLLNRLKRTTAYFKEAIKTR